MRPNFIVLICLLFLSKVYSQRFKITKTPEWVKTIEIPSSSNVSKYGLTSGYYLALGDYQVNLDENAIYTHEVRNVVSYSGITQASQLMVSYDTSYQKMKVHHLYIWRKGIKTDRTKDLSFEIMNNEYNLQNGLYMGKISAYDNLSDIRKDDMIDFAYTLYGKNPIFENGKYLFIPLESNNPVDLYYFNILYSKDKNYDYKCVDCDSSVIYTDKLTDKYREIEISIPNIKSTDYEESIPGWVIPYKYFALTSYKNWKEINTWAQSVFALKKEPDLEAVFKEIFTGTETTDEKINKLIDYVQDDIRYMGIEVGVSSIKPFSPDQVVKQRFGDCKDKSLLLVSLLKKIGIKTAHPALVNVEMQNGTDKIYPSSEIFNHCIVNFEHENNSYWVDPTITQQGGDYKTLSIENYGKALIVGKSSDSLTRIIPQNTKSHIEIQDEYTMKSFTKPARLDIKSTRYGYEADNRRVMFESYTANDITKLVSDDLKLLYPTVNKAADIVIKDNIKGNVFTTNYSFDIDGFWLDGDKLTDKKSAGYWIFKFEPQSVYDYLSVSACIDRKFDYGILFPLSFNYRVILHFPKDLLINDKYVKYDNEGFFFDEKIEQLSSNSFQVTYNFKTKAPFIKAGSYAKICEEKNKIAKSLPITIYFNK